MCILENKWQLRCIIVYDLKHENTLTFYASVRLATGHDTLAI